MTIFTSFLYVYQRVYQVALLYFPGPEPSSELARIRAMTPSLALMRSASIGAPYFEQRN